MKAILEPVAELPPNKPPKDIKPATHGEWPTAEDLFILRMRWVEGNYAGNAGCKCGYFGYLYGPTYEKKTCLDCFVEKNRPKRKYTKRKS